MKVESPNFRQIQFCHLCRNLMCFQWQRASVVIFFAVKLSTISALFLARIGCQASTWRHISVLLSAIFCSIYLTLKDVLASGIRKHLKGLQFKMSRLRARMSVSRFKSHCFIIKANSFQGFGKFQGWRPWNINRILTFQKNRIVNVSQPG